VEGSLTATGAENEVLQRASAALQRGDLQEAELLFKTILQTQPRHVAALNLLGIVLTQLGRFAEAETYLLRALNEYPNSDATLSNYGIVLKALNRRAEAVERFTQALAVNPAAAQTWHARGMALSELNRHDSAIGDFEKAIALSPQLIEAFYYRATSLALLNRFDDASAVFEQALALRPDLAEAWCGLGNVRYRLKQYDGALAAFDKALALKPALAEAWLGRGNVFCEIKRYDESFSNYGTALEIKPDLAAAWLGRGNVLYAIERYDEGIAACDKALALNPGLTDAWVCRGNLATVLKRYGEAFAAYDGALSLTPDLKYVAGQRLYAKLHMCDWTGVETQVTSLLSAIRESKPASVPFAILPMTSSPADQLQCARRFVVDQPSFPALWRGGVYSHDRIRVAYLSGNFHEHVTAVCAAGLFERHDTSRFEVSGISFGPNRNSPMRQRLQAAFERFADVHDNSDEEAADLIRRLEIDIAVDLDGHTENARLGILARRPAPIQASYLGFLGTMGADWIDYLIADKIVIPSDQQPYYAEKIVHLPDCFLVNDNRLAIAPQTPEREAAGLPAEGFVFCSFNANYKFTRPMFEVWMRLLRAVEGSVLWLAESNVEMAFNLRREAQRCGIGADRIIFAPRLALPDHLARQRAADLFLDSAPYNAGATGAAALWAGLPVLTMLGETFVGRMAASMLHAVGLPELVARSLDEYEALAVKLATSPDLLASIRRKLRGNLATAPLFDTDRFRRRLEQAYLTMAEIQRRGEQPRAFAVEPL
jgi:protein O-GlcNAc transferase